MKKFNVSARKRELNKLWADFIRTRDKVCQWCGKPHSEAHHIVPKGVCQNAGRFEVENGMALCYQCHKNRIPNDPDGYIAFRDNWLLERGLDYHEMRAKYQIPIKFTPELFELKKKVITEMLEEL